MIRTPAKNTSASTSHISSLPVPAQVSVEDPHFSLWMIHAAGRIVAGVLVAERLSGHDSLGMKWTVSPIDMHVATDYQRARALILACFPLGRGALILLRQADEYIATQQAMVCCFAFTSHESCERPTRRVVGSLPLRLFLLLLAIPSSISQDVLLE